MDLKRFFDVFPIPGCVYNLYYNEHVTSIVELLTEGIHQVVSRKVGLKITAKLLNRNSKIGFRVCLESPWSLLYTVLCDISKVNCTCIAIYNFHFQAHEDAMKGYTVRAKNKARVAYIIIGAALLIDILVVLIVIVVVKT